MFAIGWNHDIGYEFSEKQDKHADISAQLLVLLQDEPCESDLRQSSIKAIKKHGAYISEEIKEWKILNMADLTIDSKGKKIIKPHYERIKKNENNH